MRWRQREQSLSREMCVPGRLTDFPIFSGKEPGPPGWVVVLGLSGPLCCTCEGGVRAALGGRAGRTLHLCLHVSVSMDPLSRHGGSWGQRPIGIFRMGQLVSLIPENLLCRGDQTSHSPGLVPTPFFSSYGHWATPVDVPHIHWASMLSFLLLGPSGTSAVPLAFCPLGRLPFPAPLQGLPRGKLCCCGICFWLVPAFCAEPANQA